MTTSLLAYFLERVFISFTRTDFGIEASEKLNMAIQKRSEFKQISLYPLYYIYALSKLIKYLRKVSTARRILKYG